MPHDYRKDLWTPIFGVLSGTFPANSTRYCNIIGNWDLPLADVELEVPFHLLFDRLTFRISGPVGVGETIDWTLFRNGIATTLTCQIAGAVAVQNQDLVNVEAFQPDDMIAVELASSLNAVIRYCKWSLRCVRP